MRPWALYVRLFLTGPGFVWMYFMYRRSVSSPSYSALLTAVFNKCKINRADFCGHLPYNKYYSLFVWTNQSLTCVVLNCLACPHLPTPPLNFLKGTHSLCAITFFRYAIALFKVFPLIAFTVSVVFLKCTETAEILALQVFASCSFTA